MKISENIIFIIILAVIFFSLILWYVPKFQVQKLSVTPNNRVDEQALTLEKDRLKFEDEARKTLAQIIGGGVVLLGLLVTFGTYLLGVSKQDLDREAQMTDRFSKAISHIGDEKQAVRIGGLYELERVSKDSSKDSDTIKKVLLTYLHDNYSIQRNTEENTKSFEKKRELTNGLAISFYSSNTELQTLINIIQGMATNKDRIDFSQLKIVDKNFVEGDFSLANFSLSDLSGANFFASNFSGANFKSSNLSRSKSDIMQSVEIGNSLVELITPEKVKPNFSDADLTDAIITDSTLSDAIFRGAKLRNANLTNSIFYKADFTQAKLDNVIAKQTNFSSADLTQANFANANLADAQFSNSKLVLTNFSAADLSNCLGLSFEELKKAIISNETKLPSSFESKKNELLASSEKNKKENSVIILNQELNRFGNP